MKKYLLITLIFSFVFCACSFSKKEETAEFINQIDFDENHTLKVLTKYSSTKEILLQKAFFISNKDTLKTIDIENYICFNIDN